MNVRVTDWITQASVLPAPIRQRNTSISILHCQVRHYVVRIHTYILAVGEAVGFPASQPFQQHYVSPPLASASGPPMQQAWQSPAYSAPILKDCTADGCSRKVHYDQELGPFDYCSPECRDRHLLPQEQDKLKDDIEGNRKNMVTYLPQSSPPPSGSSNSSKSSAAANSSTNGKNGR